jgi:hypothetical protein
MIRRTVLAVAAVAVLALPASASASVDPLAGVKQCQQEVGYTLAALMWGEWQRPDCT